MKRSNFAVGLTYLGAVISLAFLSFQTVFAETKNHQSIQIQNNEKFNVRILTQGLDAPWDMVWGPDNSLWVTERNTSSVLRIDPVSGQKKIAAVLKGVHVGPQHEGLLGLALSPNFMKQGGDNYVYMAYTYIEENREHAKIVRMEYNEKTHALSNEKTVLAGFPAGNDHNGGRLRFGPDDKLYYTIGEQGHNQGANFCKPIQAQRILGKSEIRILQLQYRCA